MRWRIPIVALGIQDAVIVATPDGILISDRKWSARLKDYVSDQDLRQPQE